MNIKKSQIGLHLFFIVLCAVFLYPVIWMISASLKTQPELFNNSARLFSFPLHFDNYIRAWTVANFSQYFFNTLLFSISVVGIVLLVGSSSGYVLARFIFPFKKVLFVIVISTLLIPQATTIFPIFQITKNLGLLNTRIGYIIAFASKQLGMAILLFMGFFACIPKELEESGKLDGCNFFMLFKDIMFPLAKPIIGTIAILNFINSWKEFWIPLVFTFAKPGLRTLGVGMFSFMGEYSTDWTGLAAAACISTIPMMIVFIIFQKNFIEGLAGAIKE